MAKAEGAVPGKKKQSKGYENGEIFGDKDCGMGDQIKLIWVFIKKHKINE